MNLKIETYQYLKENPLIHVSIDYKFRSLILDRILQQYGSLKKYNTKKLHINSKTLRAQFKINRYFKFDRLMKIAKDIGVSEDEVFNHINVFFCRGSNTCKEVILPRNIKLDEFFIECFSLYLAEGDNGSNGKTIPRKVRFTNSELCVIRHFMNWLEKYFPGNKYYIKILIPITQKFSEEDLEEIKKKLNITTQEIKTKICEWKKKTKILYRVCLDSAVIIDLLLGMENTIKSVCEQNSKLARAYIRGMMIGEGTVYNNRSRYVRIEMRNEKEIKYIHKLLVWLGYECKTSLRTTRENMWSIYIGAKQLKKFSEIGFGIHEKRQKKLEEAIISVS